MYVDELPKDELEELAKELGEEFFHESTIYKLGYRSQDFVRIRMLTQGLKEYGIMELTDQNVDTAMYPERRIELKKFRDEQMSNKLRVKLAEKFEDYPCFPQEEQKDNIIAK